MVALTAPRSTPARDGESFSRPVKANAKIFAGALVCLDATGFAVPGAASTTLKADGRAQATVDNTGGVDGALRVEVRPGRFRFANSAAGDAIAAADIGNDCFVVDDQTVAKTNGGNTRSVAGKIVDVDAQGVWVRIGIR
jgi:hypothetical protein